MQISDFGFPDAPEGPASPRERPPLLIPHSDPGTEMAPPLETHPSVEELREPSPTRPR